MALGKMDNAIMARAIQTVARRHGKRYTRKFLLLKLGADPVMRQLARACKEFVMEYAKIMARKK